MKPVYITLHGKRDFTDVIESRILRWRYFPELSRWDNVITRVLLEARGSFRERKRDREREKERHLRMDEGTPGKAFLAVQRLGSRFSSMAF